MVLFRDSFLDQWKQRGFRYVLVMPREKYGILKPLHADKPSLKKGYTIEMSEVNLLQLTDDYFLTMDKDAFKGINQLT